MEDLFWSPHIFGSKIGGEADKKKEFLVFALFWANGCENKLAVLSGANKEKN